MQFCSAVHGRLRPAAGGVEVLLLAAGHPPPLVLRREGARGGRRGRGHAARRRGRALRSARRAVHLGPGDVLLLYTDGATELRGGEPWRGESALRETLLASAGVPLQELVERVEHQALVLSGGELRDDLALLAVGAAAAGRPIECRRVSTDMQERIARNEATFRRINEDIERGRDTEDDTTLVGFVCECGSTDCAPADRADARPSTRQVRGDSCRFAIVHGHEIPAVEAVVERHERYAVVRKLQASGAVAKETDPRA